MFLHSTLDDDIPHSRFQILRRRTAVIDIGVMSHRRDFRRHCGLILTLHPAEQQPPMLVGLTFILIGLRHGRQLPAAVGTTHPLTPQGVAPGCTEQEPGRSGRDEAQADLQKVARGSRQTKSQPDRGKEAGSASSSATPDLQPETHPETIQTGFATLVAIGEQIYRTLWGSTLRHHHFRDDQTGPGTSSPNT